MLVTYYVVIPFVENADGDLIPEEPREAEGRAMAEASALVLSQQKAGAISFSITGDLSTGDFQPPEDFRHFGQVPDDLQ